MTEKGELLRRMPTLKLWLVLTFTLAYTVVLLVADYTTHSLTLRVEVYHALYNMLSLVGCLLTVKLCSRPQSLHNTFGWARLEVLSMLSTLLFLSALCFSVAVEAIQTAVHAGHQDAMHHPLRVVALGVAGLCINSVAYCLIGGYTHHQGCFLEMRPSGGVWVCRQVTQDAVQAGRRTLSSRNLKAGAAKAHKSRHCVLEIFRDVCGVVLVILCAAVVHWDNGGTVALYIDPGLAVTSAALLMWLSYPYGKECCHILLQTIPGHIDVEEFQGRILQEFPAIVNVHHLHIWTFTPEKVVATAHVVFTSPRVYLSMKAALTHFFHEEGVTNITIQPEYLEMGTEEVLHTAISRKGNVCLLSCDNERCYEKECCHRRYQPLTSVITNRSSSITKEEEAEAFPLNPPCCFSTAPSQMSENLSKVESGQDLISERETKEVPKQGQRANELEQKVGEETPFLKKEETENIEKKDDDVDDNEENLKSERKVEFVDETTQKS